MSNRSRLDELRKRKRLTELRQMRADQASEQPTLSDMSPEMQGQYNQIHAGNPIDIEAESNKALSPLDRFSMSRPMAAIAGVGQGATFGFGDEAAGLVAAAIPGGAGYRETVDKVREGNDGIKSRHPVSFLAGEIGAGVAGGSAAIKAAPKLGSKAGTAIMGGAYGAGAAEGGAKERAVGGGIGAGLGLGAHVGLDKLGSGVSGLLQRRAAHKVPTPSLSELKTTSDKAWGAVEASGAQFAPTQNNGLVNSITQDLPLDGRQQVQPGSARRAIQLLTDNVNTPATPNDLMRVRTVASPNKVNATPAELRDSGIVQSQIDEFLETVKPETGDKAGPLMQSALEASRRYIPARELEDTLYKGGLKSPTDPSNAPVDVDGQRRAVRAWLRKNHKKLSPDVKQAAEDVVNGTNGENILRRLGKHAPRGAVSQATGAMLGGSIGSVFGPVGMAVGAAAVPAASHGLRNSADSIAEKNLQALIRQVSMGGAPHKIPTAASQAVENPQLQALLARAALVGAQ